MAGAGAFAGAGAGPRPSSHPHHESESESDAPHFASPVPRTCTLWCGTTAGTAGDVDKIDSRAFHRALGAHMEAAVARTLRYYFSELAVGAYVKL